MKRTIYNLLLGMAIVIFADSCSKELKSREQLNDRTLMASAGVMPGLSFIRPAEVLKLSKPRTRISLAQADGKVFFAGGLDINVLSKPTPGIVNLSGGAVSTVDIYDIATKSWSVAQLSEAAYGKAAVVVGKKVIFAGGITMSIENGKASEKICGTIDIYDLETKQWSAAKLRVPRSNIAAASVGTKAYFAGGRTDGPLKITNVIDVYDAATNQWSELKLSKEMCNGAAVAKGTQVIFFGGAATGTDRLNTNQPLYVTQSYETTTNKWTYDLIKYPKNDLQGVVIDSTIYLAAGDPFGVWPPDKAEEAKYIEQYPQPRTGTFPLRLQDGRTRAGVTSVGDFLVIAGGQDTLSTAAIYDRYLNKFSTIPIAGGGRFTSAITVGKQVFITGGYFTQTEATKGKYPLINYSDAVQVLEMVP